MTDSVHKVAEEACITMQAAVAALKDSCDASCPAPSRQQVQAAVQQLRMEVAKTGLMFNQKTPPTDGEATALLRGFEQTVSMLCMLYTGLVAAGGGPTLRASLHTTATAVVEACASLIRGAVIGEARDAQLMLLSGFSLEMLEAAGKAPLDNRTAIGRAITLVLKQLADAQHELAETLQAAADAAAEAAAEAEAGSDAERQIQGGAAAVAGEGQEEEEEQGDSDGSGFGFEQAAYSTEELAVARVTHGLLAAVVAHVKEVVKQLLTMREGMTEDEVGGWESMLYHIKTLAPLCDDLSAAAYPPQEVEELACVAEALATSCELLLEECPLPAPSPSASTAAGGKQQEALAADGPAALTKSMHAVQLAHQVVAQQLSACSPEHAAD
ncbi:hypothetical protein ACK3TF_000833 [Chlorella vulgaris]